MRVLALYRITDAGMVELRPPDPALLDDGWLPLVPAPPPPQFEPQGIVDILRVQEHLALSRGKPATARVLAVAMRLIDDAYSYDPANEEPVVVGWSSGSGGARGGGPGGDRPGDRPEAIPVADLDDHRDHIDDHDFLHHDDAAPPAGRRRDGSVRRALFRRRG